MHTTHCRDVCNILLLFVLAVLPVFGQGPLMQPYRQLFTDRYTYNYNRIANWGTLPFTTIVSVDSPRDNSFYVLAGEGLFQCDPQGSCTSRLSEFPRISYDFLTKFIMFSNSSFALVDPEFMAFCVAHTPACLEIPINFHDVRDVASYYVGNSNSSDPSAYLIFVATGKGLYMVNYTTITLLPLNGSFYTVAVSSDGILAAGTDSVVWRNLQPGNFNNFNNYHYFRIPGIIDAPPTDLEFDLEGNLWMPNSICINVQSRNLAIIRLAGTEGVPVGNFTGISIDHDSGEIWLGSERGIVRYEQFNQRWHYYVGPRYLTGKNLTNNDFYILFVKSFSSYSLLSSSSSDRATVVITNSGLAILTLKMITLEQKSEILDNYMINYFSDCTPQPHPPIGYLAGTSGISQFGNLTSYYTQSNDNNGLWTSVYLAGEIFKYYVTKNKEVKEKAWKYFEGLEFLNNVTGIKGLMARSVLYKQPKPSDGKWFNSTVYPGWLWKGDVSSDEVVGHMMVYPLVFHLLAESPQEKLRAQNLINNIVKYIITNGFKMIDADGKPTTWGRWDPEYLNNATWYDTRGLNAMQMLSFLISAYAITGDNLYQNAYYLLINNYQYNYNIINAKITQPSDDNYSDDELLYLSYLCYIISVRMPVTWARFRQFRQMINLLEPYFSSSIERSQKSMDYRATAYNLIYYYYKLSNNNNEVSRNFVDNNNIDPEIIMQKNNYYKKSNKNNKNNNNNNNKNNNNNNNNWLSDEFALDSIRTLQEWITDPISWGSDNSKRLDINFRRVDVGHSQDTNTILELLPYDERNHVRWNSNPYSSGPFDADDSGLQMDDPGAFIFAYWGCRFVGLGV